MDMKIKTIIYAFFLLLFFVSPIVSAATIDDYIKDAQSYLEKHDYKAAIIQLKNALQKDASNKTARSLLGQTYLEVGDILSAEKELRKARKVGADPLDWMPWLADVYLAQNKTKELIDELKITESMSQELRADMHTRYGQALYMTQDLESSEEEYRKAIKLNPNQVSALLGVAQLSLLKKDYSAAQASVDEALSLHSQNIRVLTFNAEISRTQGNHTQAKKRYEDALEVRKNYVPALSGLIAVHIALKEFDLASAAIEQLLVENPKYVNAYYFKALIFGHKNDFKSAENELRHVFRLNEEHMLGIFLMGRIQHLLENYEQAENYLSKFNKGFPLHLQTVKLLASTRLKLKDEDGAKKLLLNVKSHDSDSEILSLLGMAYAQSGEISKGTEYFERATKISPNQAKLKAQLGVSYLVGGDINEAVKVLESAVKQDSSDTRADMMLILAHLRDKNYKKAQSSALSYVEKDSNNPIAYNFLAAAYSGVQEYEKARKALEKALVINPKFSAAKINLARVESAQKNFKQARNHLKSVIKYDNKNVEAYLELAKLEVKQNNSEEAFRWIKEIRKKEPKSIEPALVHIRFLLASRKPREALDIAKNVIAIHPRNIQLLDAYANAQIANNQWDEVLSIYKRLEKLLEPNADLSSKMGRVHTQLGEKNSAKDYFLQALKLQSDHTASLVMLANLSAADKEYKAATKYVEQIKKSKPKLALGWIIEGNIYNRKKQPEKAIKAYTTALSKQKNSREAVQQLAQTYLITKENNKAVNVLRDWLGEHEKDVALRLMLAQIYQTNNSAQKAVDQYEYIINQDPKNLVALNNAAWMYAEKGDKKSLKYGEKAYDLAPTNYGVVDTYGWALVNTGQVDKGIRILQEALTNAPQMSTVRYHLAFAHYLKKNRSLARQELEIIKKRDRQFSEKSEYLDLWEKLQ